MATKAGLSPPNMLPEKPCPDVGVAKVKPLALALALPLPWPNAEVLVPANAPNPPPKPPVPPACPKHFLKQLAGRHTVLHRQLTHKWLKLKLNKLSKVGRSMLSRMPD